MDHNGTTNRLVAPQLRLRSHTRVKQTIRLNPELFEWIRKEAAAQHLTISEQVNRLLSQHVRLRKQLGAVTDVESGASLIHTLLQEHASKTTGTIESAVKTMAKGYESLDLVKAMLVFGMKALLDPQRFSQWEQDVQATMKGRRA